MQKRNLFLTLILGLSLISLVSAYYGDFSLRSLLDIDSLTMTLSLTFMVSFALVFFSLSKVFKNQNGEPNKAISGVIAFCISLGIIYGLNRINFDIESLFFDMGVSADTIAMALPILLLAGIIFFIWKFKRKSWFIIGGFFILLSFFIYEKTITLILGIILLGIGLFLWKRKRYPKEEQSRNYSSSYAK